MLYDPFTATLTQQPMPPTTHDTIDNGIPMPTPIPRRTQPITIPTRTAAQPPLYADYTDYGEVFFDEPFDPSYAFDDMIALERVPNRRDSGYETPSSPLEKLQREEHHARDAVPALWAAEHDVAHHVNVATHRAHRRRRSSSLLATPPPSAHNAPSRRDSLPSDEDAAPVSSWPAKSLGRCPTCKAALKWKCLASPPASPVCVCAPPPEAGAKRARRDAWGEEERLGMMGRFVEEHLSWPVGL